MLNRGLGRMGLFDTAADYLAFEPVLADNLAVRPMRPLAYGVMPNPRRLLLWPLEQGQLTRFMQRLTITCFHRVEYRHDRGNGHVYRGRYKSFPLQDDAHVLAVSRFSGF